MLKRTLTRRGFVLTAPALLLLGGTAQAQATRNTRPEREGTFTYSDGRLGGNVPPRSWQIFVARENQANKDYGPNRDPKFNASYPGKLQVVCGSEDASQSERAFVIHYQRPGDEAFARRVASVMARLYWLGQDYLGVGPAPGRYVNVWLSHHGEPGAEEHQTHIYLFAVDHDRAPAEWIRELAHEYAHIYLPPVGEYTAPEKWANGYLGERLFLKWLLLDNGMTDVWSEPVDGAAYVANEVVPLRKRYLNAGPASPLVNRTDAEGMEFWIGQMLAVEAAHGPAVLRSLVKNYRTRQPQNVGTHLGQALRGLETGRFNIDPAVCVPEKSDVEVPGRAGAPVRVRKASYWFYLPGGSWQLTLSGRVPEGTEARLEGMELKKTSPVAWETPASGAAGSWQRLEITAPAGKTVDLQGITVLRKG